MCTNSRPCSERTHQKKIQAYIDAQVKKFHDAKKEDKPIEVDASKEKTNPGQP